MFWNPKSAQVESGIQHLEVENFACVRWNLPVAIFVSLKHLVTNVLVPMVYLWNKMGRIGQTVSRQYFNNFFIIIFFYIYHGI